ncbi:hypothetical protein HK414_23990 [Ramlibacter terrae]|uniref:Uncharacterized protein n=1 Tax=Ramlibacter terrae TaxID=2732511 RepID=A0ABX6P5J0_9BURK|nr:hypothetical protein HK414_23990 [Ramlibacter terrae]
MDTTFDELLDSIEGLNWLPWVGSEWKKRPHRIVVLGESAYFKNPKNEELHRRRDQIRERHMKGTLDERSKYAPFLRPF